MRNRQNLLRNKSLTFWGHLSWRLFSFTLENLIAETYKGNNEYTKLNQIRICNHRIVLFLKPKMNFGQVLIFHPSHAILSPVTKTPKNQGLTRVSPISGVRSYTYSICLPRHSSDVHASMAARLIAARK